MNKNEAISTGSGVDGSEQRNAGQYSELMVAVLEDAFSVFRRGIASDDPRLRREFLEVKRWISGRADSYPLSFEHVCLYLRLDPEYVRGGFHRALCEARGKPARRSGIAGQLKFVRKGRRPHRRSARVLR